AQYFLMVLPLVALLAAETLVAGAGALGATSARRGAIVGAVALVAVTVSPLATLAGRLRPERPRVPAQLARLRAVMDATTPDQTVLDGFTGAGVFRPHAWYYFFLHDEIRRLLGAPEIGRLRAALREGEIAPALVILDDDVAQLPDEIVSFLRENYEPTS